MNKTVKDYRIPRDRKRNKLRFPNKVLKAMGFEDGIAIHVYIHRVLITGKAKIAICSTDLFLENPQSGGSPGADMGEKEINERIKRYACIRQRNQSGG